MEEKKISNMTFEEPEYVVVEDADMDLVANLLDQARGRRSVADFSYECGYSITTFNNVIRQKRLSKNLDKKLMRVIADHADPESGIQLDHMMAANGMIAKDYLDAIYRRNLRMKRTPIKKQEELSTQLLCLSPDGTVSVIGSADNSSNATIDQYIIEEDTSCSPDENLTEKEKEAEDYVRFLDELALLASDLEKKQIHYLQTHSIKMSKDKSFRFLLSKYCNMRKEEEIDRIQKMTDYFLQEDRENTPEHNKEFKELSDLLWMIKDILG